MAAALMVAGAGAGWAQSQSPIRTNSEIPGFTTKDPTGSGAAQVMSVSYTQVEPASSFTVSNKSLKDASFLNYDVDNASDKKGNTGTVVVTAQHDFWDIEFYSVFGGVLRKNGKADSAALQIGPRSTPSLKYDAVYKVSVGLDGGKLVETVDSAWFVASKAKGDNVIAFSQVMFGEDKTYDQTILDGLLKAELGGRNPNDGSGWDIRTVGFAVPATTGNKITFVVNSGLGVPTDKSVIVKSPSGTYTDTLKFTMILGNSW